MRLRPYTVADRDACQQIAQSCVPRFIAPDEVPQFLAFLDRIDELDGAYLVGEQAPESVVACGGFAMEEGSDTASLCWGLVHANHHHGGLGQRLLERRLALARAHPACGRVRLDTTQHTAAFFERFGFETTRVRRDHYAPGLDRIDMMLHFAAQPRSTG